MTNTKELDNLSYIIEDCLRISRTAFARFVGEKEGAFSSYFQRGKINDRVLRSIGNKLDLTVDDLKNRDLRAEGYMPKPINEVSEQSQNVERIRVLSEKNMELSLEIKRLELQIQSLNFERATLTRLIDNLEDSLKAKNQTIASKEQTIAAQEVIIAAQQELLKK